MRTTPVTASAATTATTFVSLQLITSPLVLPSKTLPFPSIDPKPVPVIVTEVPVPPEVGVTLAMFSEFTAKGTWLLQTPFCRTWAHPDVDPNATTATIWVSLQLCTTPFAVPSQTWPLLCSAPKPEPLIVTCVPGTPLAGDTVKMVVVLTLKATALDKTPPC